MQTLTLHLSEDIYHHLEQVAKETNQSLEALAAQAIQGNLPPLMEGLPEEWRHDLVELQSLDDRALWKVANETIPESQWEQHQDLPAQNQEAKLTADEAAKLEQLRSITDRVVLRRSYALAILKWRGHSIAQGPPRI